MAVDQLAYVESWDSSRFQTLPTRLSLEDLRKIMPAPHGHAGIGNDDFPFHREWSGLVRYHQKVVLTADDEVLSGHEAVASAIAESWCSDNPELFQRLIETWIQDAAVEAESDSRAQREEQKVIADHPQLAEALSRNPYKVFKRAQLTDREVRVVELRFDRQQSLIEIGQAFSVSKEMARQLLDKAIDKILALDADGAGD